MPPKRTGLKCALALGIVLFGWYLLYALGTHQALKRQLALARSEGLWTTMDDVANRPAPPNDRNAAVIYQPLCKSFQGLELNYTLLENGLAPGGETAFEAAYLRAGPFLTEFERAASLPDCQFQRDWRAGAGVLFPELASMKSVFKLVCYEAILMGRHGKAKEGLNLIRRFAPMAGHAGSDPIAIGGLVEVAMDAIAFRAIQTILGVHGLEPGVIEAAEAALAALGPSPDSILALKGECALMSDTMRDSANWRDILPHDASPNLELSRVSAVRDAWTAELVHAYRSTFAAVNRTGPHRSATIAELKKIEAWYSEIVGYLMFRQSNWFESLTRGEANRAALTTLISGLKSWRGSGKPPSTVPATSLPVVDPLTEKPLRFARIPGGFKVWCVGLGGVDHGGVSHAPGRSGNTFDYDIVYQYPYTPTTPKLIKPPPPSMLGGP